MSTTLDVTVEVVDAEDPGDVDLSQRQPEVGIAIHATASDDDGGVTIRRWLWERSDMVTLEMDGIANDQRKRLKTIDDELEDVKRRLGVIWNAIETSDLDISDAADRIKEHRERKEGLEDAAADARAVLSQRRAYLDDVNTISAYAKDMKDFLEESELTERRAFIESFVKEIMVIPTNVYSNRRVATRLIVPHRQTVNKNARRQHNSSEALPEKYSFRCIVEGDFVSVSYLAYGPELLNPLRWLPSRSST